MASIRFENISKSYGDIHALRDVSFEIADNDFFCLFGPPLSGKTTLLKIILGLETPDTGEVFINGKPMNGVAPADRDVAMVFQNLALFPHMSARDNVRFPLVERGIDEGVIEARVNEVAAKLHMTHILHKPPAQLSGGERQRVAIGRALVRDPVAYLMDDPISALDARLREQARVELRRIQRELNHTLVYVTHDQEEAMSVSDKMAILEDGVVRQIGAPHELYDAPGSIYVASMLGAPAINLFDAQLVGDEKPVRLHGGLPPQTQTIGVRPEDVAVIDQDGPFEIRDIEPMGATTVVSVEAQGVALKASLRGQPKFAVGQKVQASVQPHHAHFFDSAHNSLPNHSIRGNG